MKNKIIALLAIVVILAGCDAAKQQASGIYNLANCKYSFQSISNISVAGINPSEGLSLTNATRATALLSGNQKSIPFNFTLNVDVNNPNKKAALMSGMDYIISIDDIQFTTGNIDRSLNINPGQTQVLPITIGVDLATLMQTHSQNAIKEIAKNFLGMGSQQSKVLVQLRPTFNIGQSKVPSPVYIPLEFSFGGKTLKAAQ